MEDYGKILDKLNAMDRAWMKEMKELSVKTARVETQLQCLPGVNQEIKEVKKVLDAVRDEAGDAMDIAEDAQRRLNKLDTWTFLIGSTVIVAIIGAVVGLVMA